MAPEDDVEVAFEDRRKIDSKVVAIRILSVPESETYPEGVKYGFHYGEKGATTLSSDTTTTTVRMSAMRAIRWNKLTFPAWKRSSAASPTKSVSTCNYSGAIIHYP
ncbi:hypothetical protein [Halopelagius fulvigenes]|uniref:Uncharacterized protein n=1 Tax=Halopelagius fulvigenes TaxID=1198324 RepID=A0ABD5TZA5_9EURY